jgi:retron-type reverse transcriptase
MRNAKTILQVIQERGRMRLPLARVYRLLYNPNLYLLAHARIARNDGALTPGVTQETADGMCLVDTIQHVIEALRVGRYRWTPVRRVYIEKKGSTTRRPLGIPTWTDKLLQEVLRLILEAYYEPQFSPSSHGFRAGRGCHTALRDIKRRWKGTKWFIEGDIARCFDSLDHTTMLSILGRQIHDGRFLRLMKHLLTAGYLEDWTYHTTQARQEVA